MVTTVALVVNGGHMFVRVLDRLWLLDTGAPSSFGESALTLADQSLELPTQYFNLTASTLSTSVGVDCAGLLGSDVLSRFDWILDSPGGLATFSVEELDHPGHGIALNTFMDIPIVVASVLGNPHRMFFDTGAQISYLQTDALTSFPETGLVDDFYPGFGNFQTHTHAVDLTIGALPFTLRCGSLPDLLGLTLMMADTQGIIGHDVLRGRVAGYFPRRGLLVL